MVYYGVEKNVDFLILCFEVNVENVLDLIIISYGVVLLEFIQIVLKGGDRVIICGFFLFNFFWVILDEVYNIKN